MPEHDVVKKTSLSGPAWAWACRCGWNCVGRTEDEARHKHTIHAGLAEARAALKGETDA